VIERFINIGYAVCVVVIALLIRVGVARRIVSKEDEAVTPARFAKTVFNLRRWFVFCALVVLAGALSGCADPRRLARSFDHQRCVTERFEGRSDKLVWRETRSSEVEDIEKGGGFFFGTEPDVQSMNVEHTNQAKLGGVSKFRAGQIHIIVDTNLATNMKAIGDATGEVLGDGAKAFLKPAP
jgi:hypothetical protein